MHKFLRYSLNDINSEHTLVSAAQKEIQYISKNGFFDVCFSEIKCILDYSLFTFLTITISNIFISPLVSLYLHKVNEFCVD